VKESSGEEDAPTGTPPRPNRTEPTTYPVSGSVVYSPAVGKYLTEKVKRSVNGYKTYRDPSKTDNSPADAKGATRGTAGAPARRMPRSPHRGRWVGVVGTGGWVRASSRWGDGESRLRCGAVVVLS